MCKHICPRKLFGLAKGSDNIQPGNAEPKVKGRNVLM
jgi:hypothetical protein